MKAILATTLILTTASGHVMNENVSKGTSTLPTTSVTESAAQRNNPGATDPLTVTKEQAQAVERGLAWLSQNQSPNGSWKCKVGYKLNDRTTSTPATPPEGHVGVTALAVHGLPGRRPSTRARRARRRPSMNGLDFVLSCVQEDGYISAVPARACTAHAFATLFLAEIYGMTHRDDVRIKLQKAVDFIVKSQNEQGGWRYEPLRGARVRHVDRGLSGARAARGAQHRDPRAEGRRSIAPLATSSTRP